MTPPEANHRALLPTSTSLDVFLLGAMELSDTFQLLERLRNEVATRTDRHGAMLICEHPPSITIGREGSFADVLIDREELVSRRMDVRWMNRGGGTFVHTTGQLAAYVAVPLDRLNLGIAEFRTRLENSLVATAADFQVPAERSTAIPGAFGRCGQFGFVGTSVRDWTSSGGVFLNVSLAQEALELVRWSQTEMHITTLSSMRTRAIAMTSVRESLARNLAQALGYESYHLYTGHPLLRKTTKKVYVYA